MESIFDEIISRENTACVKYDRRKQVFGREDVIPFWLADMDFRAPGPVIQSLRKRLDHGILGYPVKPDGFYKSIAAWLGKRYGWDVPEEWIFFTPGVVPSVVFCIQTLTNPGDKVVLQSPVYYPLFTSIRNHGREVACNLLKNTETGYEMDFDDLESKFRDGARMILICNPHNPVGRVWNRDELARLAGLCREYKVRIVSDEIHSDIIYPDCKHIPVATIDPDVSELTITCMAPSKTFNLAGLSSSFVIIPEHKTREKYVKALRDYQLDHGNIFGLEAMKTAYESGERWLDELLAYLQVNKSLVDSFIKENIPEIKVIKTEGTFLAWLDFRKLGMNRDELNQLLIHRAGIGLSDGNGFGPGGEGFHRLNFACPRSRLLEGLDRLKNAVLNSG